MAQHQSGGGLGSVVTVGLVAGAAYLLYRSVSGASSPAPAGPSTPAGTVTEPDLAAALPASTASTAPADSSALVSQLKAAAAPDTNLVNGQMSAWQWQFYLNIIRPPGVPGAQFAAAFPDAANKITAEQFVAALQSNGGLSGLGRVTIPAPVVVDSGGRRVIVWAARDLQSSNANAGRRAAVFGPAHPFVLGVRPLPQLQQFPEK